MTADRPLAWVGSLASSHAPDRPRRSRSAAASRIGSGRSGIGRELLPEIGASLGVAGAEFFDAPVRGHCRSKLVRAGLAAENHTASRRAHRAMILAIWGRL
jgi:hypothetical protein